MKKKNPKDNKNKKQPQAPNTFVPQNLIPFIREEKPIICPEEKSSQIKNFTPTVFPFEIPPLWVEKSDEEINSELLKENHQNLHEEEKEKEKIEENIEFYNDSLHEELIKNLPLTFMKMTKNNFLWLRPEEYIINESIDKEIKKLYPKKKYIQMREDIKEKYKEEKEKSMSKENYNSEDENVDDLMNDDTQTLKKTIYKDFYKFLNNKPDIKIINSTERDETDEEYQKRVEETIEKQKENLAKHKMSKTKNEKKPIVQHPDEIPRGTVSIKQPTNIDIKLILDKEKKFSKTFISWISSIFQFIIDLKINDCNNDNSIFDNIYPRKNGMPIYNPNGHYIIKLYFMGNARRIDIDDRIPCTIDGEYILPRCENLTQIWPALLTKALLKLNIYKVKHPFYTNYEENIDTSYIYALTGFHTQILNFEINNKKNNIEPMKTDKNLNKSLKKNLNKKYSSNLINKNKNNNIVETEEEIINLLCTNLNDDNYLNKKKYVLCIKKDIHSKKGIIFYEDMVNELEKNQNIDNEREIKEENEEDSGKKLPVVKKSTQNTNEKKPEKKTTKKSSVPKYQSVSNIREISKDNNNKEVVKSKFMKKEINNILELDVKSMKDVKNRRYSFSRLKTTNFRGRDLLNKEIEVIGNFAYSIKDIFSSGEFNMLRIKALDFEDLKRKLKTNNVVFKQLSKTEKRVYIQQRKILKAEQIEIKNQRIESLKSDGQNFMIIKIVNNSVGKSKLHVSIKYNEEEIYMAKKCILNNWKYPPPDFFDNNFKKYEIVEENNDKKNKKKKISTFDWTRENYIQLIGGDLSQFNTNNIKEPIKKDLAGNWMNFSDFIKLFNMFLVLNNPNRLFNTKLPIDNNWLDFKLDCYEPSDDFVVIKLNCEEIKEENCNKMYNSFLVFEPNDDKNLISKNKIDNYIIIDVVDSNNNNIYKNITLNKFYSTYLIDNLKGSENYYIIIKGGIYQFGYYLQIYSECHKIENMSYQYYLSTELSENLRYQFSNFKVEHPLIDKQQFYLLARLRLSPTKNEENEQKNDFGNLKVIFNVKYPLKYLKPFIKIFIQNENLEKDAKEIYINEEVFLNEGSYLIAVCFKNLTSPVKENTLDINVAHYNNNYHIEQIDNIDYYEISDEYKPNKYNIIFKEKVFSCDTIYSSLNIEIKEKKPNEKNLNNKIKLIVHLYKLADKDDISVPLINKKFSHCIRGSLIREYTSFNSLIIPNLKFVGGLIIPENKKKIDNKNQTEPNIIHYPYLLICYIDESIDIKNSIAKNNLNWIIKVFSSDHLCFIGDFSKEENEKLIKSGWEENEPGRKDKAKISRKKYILQKILKSGGIITENDRLILNAERIRKITSKNDENAESNTIPNKGKKSTKIQINSKKNDEVKKEEPTIKLNFNKTLPKLTHHKSDFIRSYLEYVYKDRTKKIDTIHDQYKKTINDEKIQFEKTKKINDKVDHFNTETKIEMYSSFYKTEQPKEEMLSTFYKLDISTRTTETDMFRDLMRSRDSLKTQFQEKINANNTVNDILKNYVINSYDYAYMLQSYKDSLNILGKENDNMLKLKKLISNKKEEELKNQLKKLTNKDKANVIKIIEEIELNQLDISEEVMTKLRELIK